MPRALMAAMALLLLATACGDSTEATSPSSSSSTTTVRATSTTDSSTTTSTPKPSTSTSTVPASTATPDLVVADATNVVRLSAAGDWSIETATDVGTTAHHVLEIRMGADGTVVTEELVTPFTDGLGGVTELAVYDPDGARRVIEGRERLFDLAVIDGVESVITEDPWSNVDFTGDLVAVDVATGAERAIGVSWELLGGTNHIDWAAGMWVATGPADQTESVTYHDLAGHRSGLPSPTDDMPYNQPPFVTAASLSPDGKTVHWAEGPDGAFDPDRGEFVFVPSEWRVKSMVLESREELLDVAVSEVVDDPAALGVSSIHDTGDHLIVNRSMWIDGVKRYVTALVLDLADPAPDPVELPLHGVAAPVPAG